MDGFGFFDFSHVETSRILTCVLPDGLLQPACITSVSSNEIICLVGQQAATFDVSGLGVDTVEGCLLINKEYATYDEDFFQQVHGILLLYQDNLEFPEVLRKRIKMLVYRQVMLYESCPIPQGNGYAGLMSH
jgi:hypothetical protein